MLYKREGVDALHDKEVNYLQRVVVCTVCTALRETSLSPLRVVISQSKSGNIRVETDDYPGYTLCALIANK